MPYYNWSHLSREQFLGIASAHPDLVPKGWKGDKLVETPNVLAPTWKLERHRNRMLECIEWSSDPDWPLFLGSVDAALKWRACAPPEHWIWSQEPRPIMIEDHPPIIADGSDFEGPGTHSPTWMLEDWRDFLAAYLKDSPHDEEVWRNLDCVEMALMWRGTVPLDRQNIWEQRPRPDGIRYWPYEPLPGG